MGYKANDVPPESRDCPTPEAVIEQYLKITKFRKPGMLPADPFQAARYWMAHQCQADDFTEGATPPLSKGGPWGTPYHDRLLYTLRKFLRLKAVQQVYVIEHIEKGIPWKGEDFTFYLVVVDETIKMKGDPKQYIEDGFVTMARAAKGMVSMAQSAREKTDE